MPLIFIYDKLCNPIDIAKKIIFKLNLQPIQTSTYAELGFELSLLG